jgi:uncharacterized membrane protein
MARPRSASIEDSFFNIQHARWVIGVLSMLVAVVGKESLLGLILRQARSEINSIVRHEEAASPATAYKNN